MIVCAFTVSIWMYFGLVEKCHAMPDILPSIMNEFKIYQPTIIQGAMLEMKKMTKVVKNFNYQGYSIGFSQKQLNRYQSGVILTNDLSQFKWNNPTRAPILVVSTIETEEDLKGVDVSIGSEVLFLDSVSLKVYESYTINKIQITKYLGQFHVTIVGQTIFVPSQDYISNMENRRVNFYGKELTCAIPRMKEDPENYLHLVKFFPKNNTYDITKLANNPKYFEKFWDILELTILNIMEGKYNFTSKIILRRDMKIGSPHISSNGTAVISKGVFQNLVAGSIDFVIGPFTMSPIRLLFVDFLPASWSAHDAIFVQNDDTSEEIDWKVFSEPFAIEVWIAIVIKCIIFTALVSIIEWFHDCKLVRRYYIVK